MRSATSRIRGCGDRSAEVREGARVVVADVSADGVKGTAELITKAGGEATGVVADVSKPADVSAMMTVTRVAGANLRRCRCRLPRCVVESKTGSRHHIWAALS